MCPTIIQQEMRLLKISWISLLATGIGILGFGIIVTVYPLIAGHTEEGLLRAIGVATTGMGIFGVMITPRGLQKKGKMGMVYSLVLSYFLDNTFGGWIAARKRSYPSNCFHCYITIGFATSHQAVLFKKYS